MSYVVRPLGLPAWQLNSLRRVSTRTLEQEAAAVLAAMGLTLSDAIRFPLTRDPCEKALRFAPLVPNPERIAAMKEARGGDLPSFEDAQGLLDDLHADD